MNKHKKNKSKGQSLGKGTQFYKAIKWHKFGGPNHIAKKCNISQPLVDLYQKIPKGCHES
jgi:hypothetical protein